MGKKELLKLILNITAFIFFIGLIIFISVKYTPILMKLISNKDKFKEYIISSGLKGVLIYIFFQVIHVFIVIFPGEFLQIAGGYIYGTLLGTLYTFIGIMIGVVLVFFITKILGYSVVKIIIPKDKLEKFNFLINNPKAEIIMFILFLIPLSPKDALTYIAGLTPVKPMNFFILCSLARLPGIVVSAFMGKKLQTESYIAFFIVSIIAVMLGIIGILFQKRIINFLHNLRHKEK